MSINSSRFRLRDLSRGTRRSQTRWGYLTLMWAFVPICYPVTASALVHSRGPMAPGRSIDLVKRSQERGRD